MPLLTPGTQLSFPPFPYPAILNPAQHPFGTRLPANEQGDRNGLAAEGPGNDGDNSDEEAPDPRAAKSRNKPAPKSKSQRLVHSMIRIYLQSKGIIPPSESKKKIPKPPTDPPTLPNIPQMVDPGTLESYRKGRHPGPRTEDVQVAWSESMQHPWNKAVIKLLSSEFRQNVKACRYQLLPKLPDDAGKAYVKGAIEDKLSSRQTSIRDTMQKMKDNSHLTNAELSRFFSDKKQEKAAKARRRERKKYLFIRRAEIIENALNTPWEKDSVVWREIETVFKLFDEKDMSSDETETEARFGANKETRRIRKPWIDNCVSNLFHFVDSQYSSQLPGGMLKRGSAPLRRHLEARKVNIKSHPKPGLPSNVYGPHEAVELLKPQPPNEFLNIPQFADHPQAQAASDSDEMEV